MSFWAVPWVILGRTREARDDVWEDAEAVCSLRMVLLCAMQALEVVSLRSAVRRRDVHFTY